MSDTLEVSASQKRLPAREKKISELSKNDVRVRLFGRVIDTNDNIVVIDDGTGKINVTFNDHANAKTGMTVRVFGKVMPAEDGFEIEGEILQDMGGVDVPLYKKAAELERNA